MNLGGDLHVLVLFDKQGREVYRGPRAISRTLPTWGGSYLIEPDRELAFRPYRRDHFATERRDYLSPGRPRMSNLEKIASAKRFSNDGEEDNALAMLALLK